MLYCLITDRDISTQEVPIRTFLAWLLVPIRTFLTWWNLRHGASPDPDFSNFKISTPAGRPADRQEVRIGDYTVERSPVSFNPPPATTSTQKKKLFPYRYSSIRRLCVSAETLSTRAINTMDGNKGGQRNRTSMTTQGQPRPTTRLTRARTKRTKAYNEGRPGAEKRALAAASAAHHATEDADSYSDNSTLLDELKFTSPEKAELAMLAGDEKAAQCLRKKIAADRERSRIRERRFNQKWDEDEAKRNIQDDDVDTLMEIFGSKIVSLQQGAADTLQNYLQSKMEQLIARAMEERAGDAAPTRVEQGVTEAAAIEDKSAGDAVQGGLDRTVAAPTWVEQRVTEAAPIEDNDAGDAVQGGLDATEPDPTSDGGDRDSGVPQATSLAEAAPSTAPNGNVNWQNEWNCECCDRCFNYILVETHIYFCQNLSKYVRPILLWRAPSLENSP